MAEDLRLRGGGLCFRWERGTLRLSRRTNKGAVMSEKGESIVVVDGKEYRPGELISVEWIPSKYTTGGWANDR